MKKGGICIFPENKFKKTVDAISLGLLLQAALMQFTPPLLSKLMAALNIQPYTATYTNVGMVFSIILYFSIFILPAIFVYVYVPKTEPQIRMTFSFPKNTFLIIAGAIGIISFASQITAILQMFFEPFGITFIRADISAPNTFVGLILFTIYMAITPAVVEELLFRKVILNSLLPYGKPFAIIFSALMFALMHCNPSQTIYTFVAGIILAYAAIETKSIILPMCIHFCNNLLSVIYICLQTYTNEEIFTLVATIIDNGFKVASVFLIISLAKKGFFNLRKDIQPYTTSQILKNSIRILLIAYILYSMYLSTEWIDITWITL